MQALSSLFLHFQLYPLFTSKGDDLIRQWAAALWVSEWKGTVAAAVCPLQCHMGLT